MNGIGMTGSAHEKEKKKEEEVDAYIAPHLKVITRKLKV